MDLKANQNLKVNGKSLEDLKSRKLIHNDRISLGPKNFFLYKDHQHEELQTI